MTSTHDLPAGTTLRLLFQGCECEPYMLFEPERVIPDIKQSIEDSGLTQITHVSHAFDEGGYTAAVILAESHVAIHTWPEFDNLVLVDVSVCDFYRINRHRTLDLGERLKKLFKPKNAVQEVLSMVPRVAEESMNGAGSYVELKQILEHRKSVYQDIIVSDTPAFGRTLVLDGYFQTSEKDHVFYHEPLVHIPMLAHAEPRTVFICGGGDGGAAHAVLQHPSVERCVLVDIDRDVIDVSRQHLQALHQGALDDPRVEVHAEDAAAFIKKSNDIFDVVIFDTTDPGSCADTLFTHEFFQNARAHMTDDALLSMHVGCPMTLQQESTKIFERVSSVMDAMKPYMQFVPGYGTLMAFGLGQVTKASLPGMDEIAERIRERELTGLQVIAPDTCHALFAIPPLFRKFFPGVVWENQAFVSVSE